MFCTKLELSQDGSDKHALLVLGGHRMPRHADKDVSSGLGLCPGPKAAAGRTPMTWVAFTAPTSFLLFHAQAPHFIDTNTTHALSIHTYTHLGAVPKCILSAPPSVCLASSAARAFSSPSSAAAAASPPTTSPSFVRGESRRAKQATAPRPRHRAASRLGPSTTTFARASGVGRACR